MAQTQCCHPVIFLPGIMGSVLRDEYPVDPETVWSPLKLLMKAYDRITLHPSDTRYDLAEPSRVGPDQVFSLVYSELILELRHNLSPQADEVVPVFPFAYDWRQPLETVEGHLADFIEEVIDRTRLLRHYHDAGFGTDTFPAKVNLVAHSMGGLIVAAYLQKAGLEKVHKVVTVASPFRGSLEAVSKTTTGVGALGISAGSSREREAARVTPALYYLLPSYSGAVTADEGLLDDLFTADAWQPGVLQTLASFVRMYGLIPANPEAQARTLLTGMLQSARRFRRRLERIRLDDPKMWLSIVGVDGTTRVTMRIAKGPGGNPWFELDDASNAWSDSNRTVRVHTGDNTVPYLGARCPFIPTEQVVCVTPADYGFWEFKDRLLELMGFHAALPSMNLVQRLIVSHLKGRIYGEVWGRPAPDLDPETEWDPPIAGLSKR
jgi:pimeloyl-ACP methyl ester carboxylesterase